MVETCLFQPLKTISSSERQTGVVQDLLGLAKNLAKAF